MTYSGRTYFPGLAWALPVSLSCHLLLAAILLASQDQPEMMPLSPAPYQISLAPGPSAVSQTAPAPAKKQHQANRTEPRKTVMPTTAKATTTPVQPATATSDANRQTSREQLQQLARNHVLSYVEKNIPNYFYYPRLAQRNGWQGKVILRIDVDARGQIATIQLVSSSGYAILDESAINAMSRIQQIQDMQQYGEATLHVEVPVIYRLKQG